MLPRSRRQRSEYDLSDEEQKIWYASVSGAALASSLLRPTMMLLHPYRSKIVSVAGIDKDWRVALGPRFFTYSQAEREAIVVHVCLHAVCNYSSRSQKAGQNDKTVSRIAQDLEINQMVITLSRVRLPDGSVVPDIPGARGSGLHVISVPPGKTMEQYYQLMAHGDGTGEDGSQPSGSRSDSEQDDGNDDHNRSASSGGSKSPSSKSSRSGNDQSEADGSDTDPESSQDESRKQDPRQAPSAAKASDPQSAHDQSSQDQRSSGQPDEPSRSGGRQQSGDGSGKNDPAPADEGRSGDSSDGSASSDDSEGSGKPSDQPSNDDVCANASEDEIAAEADSAGIHKSRSDQKVTATSKMVEEANRIASITGRMPGIGTKDKQFAIDIAKAAEPPVMDWRRNLIAVSQDLMSKQAYKKTEYSFKRVNRRGSAFMKDVAFPSVVGYNPRVMMAIDTSYSVSHDEKQTATIARNAEEIMKAVTRGTRGAFKVFCVDTTIKETAVVETVDDLNLTGGGGTDMSPAFEYISSLNRSKRPDVFILATDGGLSDDSWNRCADAWPKNVKVIILITDSYYLDKIPRWLYDDAQVIDVSGKTDS
jgi:predicted metal-dependent peptidase